MNISEYRNTERLSKSISLSTRFLLEVKRCKYKDTKNKFFRVRTSSHMWFIHFFFNADINKLYEYTKPQYKLHRFIGVTRRL
jgi:hypothetical protein